MEPLEAYRTYVALKRHFNSKQYDYHKYDGRVRANQKSLDNRRDKYFFHKLCKKYNKDDFIKILVANFIENDNLWAGDVLLDSHILQVYVDWQKRIQSLTYTFQEEVRMLIDYADEYNITFVDLFRVIDEQHPHLLVLALRKEVSLETMIILEELFHFFDVWTNKCGDKIIWPHYKEKCLNYRPFMLQYIDLEKIRSWIREEIY